MGSLVIANLSIVRHRRIVSASVRRICGSPEAECHSVRRFRYALRGGAACCGGRAAVCAAWAPGSPGRGGGTGLGGRAVRLGRLWRSCDVRRLAGRGGSAVRRLRSGSEASDRRWGWTTSSGQTVWRRAAHGTLPPGPCVKLTPGGCWSAATGKRAATEHGRLAPRTVPSRLSFGGTQTESGPRLPFPGRGPGAGGEGQRPVGADLPGCAPTGLGAARGCGPRAGELGLRVDSAWSCLVRLARSRRRGYSHTFRARTANGDCGTYVPPPG
ncbi:hypothetical protein A4R44_08767 [Amycolatopsis sp. M39]|nr:hypothetical protein A4R44_08767 [Amycolatopsis sp. M39]